MFIGDEKLTIRMCFLQVIDFWPVNCILRDKLKQKVVIDVY